DEPDRAGSTAFAILRKGVAKELTRGSIDRDVVIGWFTKRALTRAGFERRDAERHGDRPPTEGVIAQAATDSFRKAEKRRLDLRQIGRASCRERVWSS